jgi:circadian clock protein KaiC
MGAVTPEGELHIRTRETNFQRNGERAGVEKAPTGIEGLDQVTGGGVPRGRPTLICGGPGCGKTLFGIEFLVRGAMQFDEPGVMMTFEETAEDIRKNVTSLGFDIDRLVRQNKLAVDYVRVQREEIDENGEYDLEGLFIRLKYAIDKIGAKRVMLDTVESLFAGLSNEAILRSELRRLFYWLKQQGMTTVITAEQGEGKLTRQGLEEYVSDCVILLDHRVVNQVSTRRLRVVKYRGSTHGTNEYPFLIDEDGISVLPITSASLNHNVSTERISTGVERIDAMLGGAGLYRGSSVLITGTAGTGKSTLAAAFAAASCARAERCLYFAFEESQSQIIRNMKSVGLDLGRYVKDGVMQFFNARPSLHGLEMHLAVMHKQVERLKPTMVVIDPVSNFTSSADRGDVHAMLVRLVDYLKGNAITGIFTNLTGGNEATEATDMGISSIMDTWFLLRDIELGGERNRAIYVLKSRGMKHSNQIREFLITPHGIDLLDVYAGPEGVLTGSARLAQEAIERAADLIRQQERARRQTELERKRRAFEAQVALLKAEFEQERDRITSEISIENLREQRLADDRAAMASSRQADKKTNKSAARKRES